MSRRKANSSESPTIVVFRDKQGLKEAAKIVPEAILIESIRIVPQKIKAKFEHYDYGIISSVHAVSALRKWPEVDRWIAIGERTKAALKKKVKAPVRVLKDNNSQGLKNFFKSKSGVRIFYPRSSLTDSRTLRSLAGEKNQLDAPIAYKTYLLSLRSQLKRLSKNSQNFIFVVLSPSSVRSIVQSGSLDFLKSRVVAWLAIGPTTAREIRSFGFSVQTARETNLRQVLREAKWLRSK
jgi:uroporphyrinogen-III synthase